MEQRDFFISYTKTDKDSAVWIAETLKSNGYSVYIQALDIHPGDNFIEKMNGFLENSRNFIPVWSKAYSESRFCKAEFQAAFNQWTQERIDCFLPVRIENHPMEPLFAALVHADLFGKNKSEAEQELIDAVRYATPQKLYSEERVDFVIRKERENAGIQRQSRLRGRQKMPVNTGSHSENKPNNVMNTEPLKPSSLEPVKRPSMVRLFMSYALVSICTAVLVLIGNATLPRLQEIWEGYNLYQTGENYYWGKNGVEQSYTKARQYYEQAAAKGNADAINNLGLLYYTGYGIAKNYDKAQDYYEKAAAKGSVVALNNLGVLYQYVNRDYAKARDYYQQAAAKLDANALYNLGYLYQYGFGVEKDYNKALEYYEKADIFGDEAAATKVEEVRKKLHG